LQYNFQVREKEVPDFYYELAYDDEFKLSKPNLALELTAAFVKELSRSLYEVVVSCDAGGNSASRYASEASPERVLVLRDMPEESNFDVNQAYCR